MSSASKLLGTGGKLGSASFTAGRDLTAGDKVSLGQDSKVYPVSGESFNFTDDAGYRDEYSGNKTIELGNGHLVSFAGTDVDGVARLRGHNVTGDVITFDTEVVVANYDNLATANFDLVPIASASDQFYLVSDAVGGTVALYWVCDYDGAGTFNQSIVGGIAASGRPMQTVLDMGTSGGNNEMTTVSYDDALLTQFRGMFGTNVIGVNTEMTPNLVQRTWSIPAGFRHRDSTDGDKITIPAIKMQDGVFAAIVGTYDNTKPNILAVCQGDADTVHSLTDLTTARCADRPSGLVKGENDNQILAACITNYSASVDGGELAQPKGEVIQIFSVTTTDSWATTSVGTPLKLDSIIEGGGTDLDYAKTPVHVFKDSDNNYIISYNGIIHKVSVNWTTRVVTTIFTGADKRHFDLGASVEGNPVSGSMFAPQAGEKSTLVPISGNRFIYSEASAGLGKFTIYDESFLKAGSLMKIGTAQTTVTAGNPVTVSLDAALNSVTTGDTYTVGAIVNETNRAITVDTIAENIAEFDEGEYPEMSDCFIFPLVSGLGWTAVGDVATGYAYLDKSVSGVEPLAEFLNVKGAGMLSLLFFQNTTAGANRCDYDVIRDGEVYASQRDGSLDTGTGASFIIAGNNGASRSPRENPIRFEKSLIIRARNREGNATAQTIRVTTILRLKR